MIFEYKSYNFTCVFCFHYVFPVQLATTWYLYAFLLSHYEEIVI
ncbi:hypothetical protein RchiOBHm_Chr5g0017061 [Rosa chinensis]|uniref:Uncharacterized protein n=1 Tax=Rosa chinensis TaxID=74649 RepID=A0A2P6Q6E0_ROSCH|nr:hypothetical protein RchiOBHm_Chr5g0017061 [Rosa chinensis]